MVTVPAFVWRGGFVSRVAMIGGTFGVCLGFLAWLDSGFLVPAVIVLLVVGPFYGIWMARRMARYWPESTRLSGDDRVAAARCARRGERVGDPNLAQPVIDYARGLHESAETGRRWRWLLILVLVVGVATTAWDWYDGSWGNFAASVIYLAALIVEVFWWPKQLRQLLSNADRAAGYAAI